MCRSMEALGSNEKAVQGSTKKLPGAPVGRISGEFLLCRTPRPCHGASRRITVLTSPALFNSRPYYRSFAMFADVLDDRNDHQDLGLTAQILRVLASPKSIHLRRDRLCLPPRQILRRGVTFAERTCPRRIATNFYPCGAMWEKRSFRTRPFTVRDSAVTNSVRDIPTPSSVTLACKFLIP
jgi:hypothetical protein